MAAHSSLFAQLLQLIPLPAFQRIVREEGGERCAKGFTCRVQLVAMLYLQLAQAKSLSEICDGPRQQLARLCQRARAPDLDSTVGVIAGGHVPVPFDLRLAHIPPAGAPAREPVYLSASVGLARRSVSRAPAPEAPAQLSLGFRTAPAAMATTWPQRMPAGSPDSRVPDIVHARVSDHAEANRDSPERQGWCRLPCHKPCRPSVISSFAVPYHACTVPLSTLPRVPYGTHNRTRGHVAGQAFLVEDSHLLSGTDFDRRIL